MQEIIRTRLSELGLTTGEAARMCGITGETMTVLCEGYVTLPCLAIKVGHGLGLTREQVKQIGQALDREAWERRVDKVQKGQELDFEKDWWQKYRYHPAKPQTKETEDKACGRYLDIRKVAEWAMAHEMSVREVLRRADIGKTSSVATETGARKVEALEKELGLAKGALRRRTRPVTYRVEVRAEMRKRAVDMAMREHGLSASKLAERMGCSTDVVQTKISRGNNECGIEVPFARRMADALGRPLKELFELRIVETVYLSKQ